MGDCVLWFQKQGKHTQKSSKNNGLVNINKLKVFGFRSQRIGNSNIRGKRVG
jgi:hypothetical protein